MSGKVKKILQEVQTLNGRDKAVFIHELPKIIFYTTKKANFSDEQIADLAAIAKKRQGIKFESLAEARGFVRNEEI